MPNSDNLPQLPKNQSAISTNGVVSRDWYRFFLNLLNKVNEGGGGGNGTGTVTSVNVSGGATGLTTSGGPITTNGTITLNGTVNVAHGGTNATTAAGARTNLDVPSTNGTGASGTWGINVTGTASNISGVVGILNGGTGATTAPDARTNLGAAASGANSDITSLSGLTGSIASPTYVDMGNGSAVSLAAGRMWYDPTTGAWNLGMGNGNITQQVGEELFIYGKASSAITDSPLQIVYHTGTVGASGVIKFAPTISGITDVNAILGVATESIALNDFGRITAFGVVHGITTNGAAFGETWADDDVIWYDPVTGNPTKFEPSAPNIKVQIGLVINAGAGGSGSFQVLLRPGSVLGGSDSNVKFTTLANSDLIQYDSTAGYWKNVTPASVTGIGSLANALTIGTGLSGTSYNGSAAVTINNTGVTSLTGTASQVNVSASTGAVTLSLPATINVNTTGTAGNVTGVVAVLNGGTGQTSYTDGQLLIGNSTGNTLTKATLTPGSGISITNGAGSITISATGGSGVTSVTGTSPVFSSGGTTPDISLTSGYGDTQNPYASKTANYILAAPNGTAGVPTFRAIVPADIPTLNQNTTGTAGNVTGVVAIPNGGTGQTTQISAFNALAPTTLKGDLIVNNGTANVRQAVGNDTYVLTANSSAATGISWAPASGGGATISNDTTTSTNVYPTFAAATSGSLSTIYTSNAKYLYKPSTGELTSPEVVASNGIFVNSQTISANYTIPTGSTAISGGPITVTAGFAVTVSTGARWVTI